MDQLTQNPDNPRDTMHKEEGTALSDSSRDQTKPIPHWPVGINETNTVYFGDGMILRKQGDSSEKWTKESATGKPGSEQIGEEHSNEDKRDGDSSVELITKPEEELQGLDSSITAPQAQVLKL